MPSKKVVVPKPGIPPARIPEIASRSRAGMTSTDAHRSPRYAERCFFFLFFFFFFPPFDSHLFTTWMREKKSLIGSLFLGPQSQGCCLCFQEAKAAQNIQTIPNTYVKRISITFKRFWKLPQGSKAIKSIKCQQQGKTAKTHSRIWCAVSRIGIQDDFSEGEVLLRDPVVPLRTCFSCFS